MSNLSSTPHGVRSSSASDKPLYTGSIVELGPTSFGEEKDGCGKHGGKIMAVIVLVLVAAGIAVGVACGTGNCGKSGGGDGSPCSMDCDDPKWGYTDTDGAHCWAACYGVCGGSQQSPINLDSGAATIMEQLDPLALTNYEIPQDFELSNNGHTVNVGLQSSSVHDYIISGLGLPGDYIFAGFHLHWGASSARGSEHTLNGKDYPMEVHLVHFSSEYESVDEAIAQPQGLAVLGFLFKVSPVDNPALAGLVSVLQDIRFKDDASELANLTLSSLLPTSKRDFYRYDGSLTTPPCYESVVWTVFTDTAVDISERQLNVFRSVLFAGSDTQSDPLVDTYRSPLPLGRRTLHYGRQP